jgi:hypothetical protein
MSDSTFIDALGDDRTRWLNGDPDAWASYSASCLRLEAEVRSSKSACTPSPQCTCSRACRTSDAKPHDDEADA